jgi:hypothetical protein
MRLAADHHLKLARIEWITFGEKSTSDYLSGYKDGNEVAKQFVDSSGAIRYDLSLRWQIAGCYFRRKEPQNVEQGSSNAGLHH